MTWTAYRRTGVMLMRPYEPGEDLSNISVSQQDHPKAGGMIAQNPENALDQWYIDPTHFVNRFEPITREGTTPCLTARLT